MITGTRTQVAEIRRSGAPRILRVSFLILSSSDDQPSGRSEPAHGMTLSASGASKGPPAPTAGADVTGPLAERPVSGDRRELVVERSRCLPARHPTLPGRKQRTSRRSRYA